MNVGVRTDFTGLADAAAAAHVACYYVHHIEHGCRWPTSTLGELGYKLCPLSGDGHLCYGTGADGGTQRL